MSYQNDSAIAACNRIERDLRSGGLDDEADGAATCVAELQHLGGRAEPRKLDRVMVDTPSGSIVAVVDDRGSVTITATRSEPWFLGDGTLVVKVAGRSGGYRADRCHVIA